MQEKPAARLSIIPESRAQESDERLHWKRDFNKLKKIAPESDDRFQQEFKNLIYEFNKQKEDWLL